MQCHQVECAEGIHQFDCLVESGLDCSEPWVIYLSCPDRSIPLRQYMGPTNHEHWANDRLYCSCSRFHFVMSCTCSIDSIGRKAREAQGSICCADWWACNPQTLSIFQLAPDPTFLFIPFPLRSLSKKQGVSNKRNTLHYAIKVSLKFNVKDLWCPPSHLLCNRA